MTESPLERSRDGLVDLAWSGRPAWGLVDTGGSVAFVGSDAGEWATLAVGAGAGTLTRAALGPVSAACVSQGRLLVAAFRGEVLELGDTWGVRGGYPGGAAVLALAADGPRVCAGDAKGRLWVVGERHGAARAGAAAAAGAASGAGAPAGAGAGAAADADAKADLELDGPVLALVACAGGLAALAGGALWWCGWPDEAGGSRRVALGIGRGYGLWTQRGRVGVWGEDACAWVDEGREAGRSPELGGLRSVLPLGEGVCVLRDDGGLESLDAGLHRLRPLELPGRAKVAGIAAAPGAEVLAWTDDGALFRVDARGVRWLADGDVALACAAGGGVWIVRAQGGRVRVERKPL